MDTMMSEEAVEFGRQIERALGALGGFEFVRAVDAGETGRTAVDDALGVTGTWELDVRKSDTELEAAALACRAAGRWAMPYPVAERLAAGPASPRGAVAVCGARRPRVNHADLDLTWMLCDGAGRAAPVIRVGGTLGSKLGRFVAPVEVGDWEQDDDGATVCLTLQAWTLLGMLDRARDLTRDHVQQRTQFGTPLASFQHVRFSLTEVMVHTQSLTDLAKYTLWSVSTKRPGRWTDVLALRLAALEAAESVFRTCHQLHGASGFCDETPISWLSRDSQPLRRLPWGLSRTEEILLQQLEHSPLDGPFARLPEFTEGAA
jgi:hypothetical protein